MAPANYHGHALCQFSGNWGSLSDLANEVWSFGIRVMSDDPTGWLEDPQQYAQDIKTNIISMWSIPGNFINSQAFLTNIKVNNINATGHYADPVTHQTAVVPVAGGKTLTNWVAFNSVCITFGTGRSSGRAKMGRIYPPNVAGVGVDRAVSVVGGDQASHVNAWKSVLATLKRAESGGSHRNVVPVIASRIDQSIHPITSVSVNSVIDVQRRRKNRAVATRTTAAFP